MPQTTRSGGALPTTTTMARHPSRNTATLIMPASRKTMPVTFSSATPFGARLTIQSPAELRAVRKVCGARQSLPGVATLSGAAELGRVRPATSNGASQRNFEIPMIDPSFPAERSAAGGSGPPTWADNVDHRVAIQATNKSQQIAIVSSRITCLRNWIANEYLRQFSKTCGGARRRHGFGIGFDPGGDEFLQPPQLRVVNTQLFQMRDGVEQIFRHRTAGAHRAGQHGRDLRLGEAGAVAVRLSVAAEGQ